MITNLHAVRRFSILTLFVGILFVLPIFSVYAATLKLSPETGVYTVGGTINAKILINTAGKPINAAEGALSYNPKELQVLSISKAGSIFNLWTIEPTFANATGKVTFGGGSPSGYTGGAGVVATVTFKVLAAGTPKVIFSSGSILAADGQGTNVLTAMNGGTYTTSAATNDPEPEYIAPANTPSAPQVTSSTHPDPLKWYTETVAKLSWQVPAGVTAVRTLVDTSRATIPTVVYDSPIKEKEVTDLSGVSYFHIQFKNSEGWGKVTHYRLAVDTTKPESFSISLDESSASSPKKRLIFKAVDSVSGIKEYSIQIDGGEKVIWQDIEGKGIYELPLLPYGDHFIAVDAIDFAQNTLSSSITVRVDAFEAPVFTDYPTEIQENIIPVIKGTTRAHAKVFLKLSALGVSEDTGSEREVLADGNGTFTFVPEGRLARGVYEITARAVDQDGVQSMPSEVIRIAVQESGIKRVGGSIISVLSVIVPLVALVVLLAFVVVYGYHRTRRLRTRLRKEVIEAERSLANEFEIIIQDLHAHVEELKLSKEGKHTRAEAALLNSFANEIKTARNRVAKEIQDVERILGKK